MASSDANVLSTKKRDIGPTTAVCAIMKNEAPYILEWVAFHSVIGFNEIFIYDNDSTDGTRDLLARLSSAGVVKQITWDSVDGIAPQLSAYADALLKVNSEWVCFIDADEFINLKQDDSIQALLRRYPSNASAIAMNWRVFGSDGLSAFEPELVTRRFIRASHSQLPVNRHCKTIARVADIKEMHIHRCFLRRGIYVDETGGKVEIERLGLTPTASTNIVQVNHYVVKSREEFAVKRSRGNANRAADQVDKYERYQETFFAAHDRNDESDLSIQRFDSRLSDEIARLTQIMQG